MSKVTMIFQSNIKYLLVSVITLLLFNNTMVFAEEFAATLFWSKRVELSTPVNGLVQKVYAQPGKIVTKDEILVQLDSRAFQADLKYAIAAYKNADEQNQEAKRELERQNDMYERTMLSEHDLQIAKNNYTATKAQFYQAESSLTKAKLNLEYSAIAAPFNAIVISISAVKGQVVASEITPPILVIVAEAQRMLARFYAVSNKINHFVVGQSAKVKISGKTYKGKVLSVALEPEKSKPDHYAVDVIFSLKDNIFRAGQKVKVAL